MKRQSSCAFHSNLVYISLSATTSSIMCYNIKCKVMTHNMMCFLPILFMGAQDLIEHGVNPTLQIAVTEKGMQLLIPQQSNYPAES